MRGRVYVIDDGEHVKIGAAVKPAQRLSAVRMTCKTARLAFVTDEIENVGPVERLAQRRLSARRVSGEWFGATADEAIEAVLQGLKDAETSAERFTHRGAPLTGRKEVLQVPIERKDAEKIAAYSRGHGCGKADVLRDLIYGRLMWADVEKAIGEPK